MKDIKIFKVGGSALSKATSFQKIAKRILQYNGSRICIVTSAMKGKTNELIKTFLDAIPQPDFWNFERFVGIGEIQSAILFESAFNSLMVDSKAVLPWMKEWPLYISLKSKEKLSREKINEKRNFTLLNESKERVEKKLLPLFKRNTALIIPGFIAKDKKGRVITLGRGGSDISAFLMAELLHANDLILIKDVDCIYSLDPKMQTDSERIKYLDSNEIGIVASSGAQILNPVSLKYGENLKKIKVISAESESESLEDVGTEISFDSGITIKSHEENFSVLTFVGEEIPQTPGILKEISEVLAENEIPIHSTSISDNLIAIYVEGKNSKFAYRLLSPLIVKKKKLKVLNLKENIGKIVVRSLKFINEPGIIEQIVAPISEEGINSW